MKYLYMFLIAMSIATLSHGQVKVSGGLLYSNVGPKTQISVTEFFEQGNFYIRTSASYSYQYNHKTYHFDGSFKEIVDRHHIEAGSLILFRKGRFDYGGGFSYRFFAPVNTGSVGVKLAGLYNINEVYNVEVCYDRTVVGENFVSLGFNMKLF